MNYGYSNNYRAMKKVLTLLTVALFLSCQPELSDKEIKLKIGELKDQINNIEFEIKDLEKQLKDSVSENDGKVVRITIDTVKQSVFKHFFEVGGTVEATNSAFISPEMNGQIKNIYVKEGQKVKKGDLLVSLNDNVLQSTIQEVQIGLELASKVYEKQKELWQKQIGSEIQYLEAKTNKESLESKLKTVRAQLEMTKVRAPFDGIVDAIHGKQGELAAPGYELVRLVNLEEIKVNADVAESYISKVQQGENVTITLPSYPDIQIVSKVARVGTIIKPGNRTFEIEVPLQNEKELIRPNSIAVVTINDYTNTKAIAVPTYLVKKDVSNNSFLFVAEKTQNGYVAKKVSVAVGKVYNGKTEITSGLAENMLVIDKGHALVSNGIEVEF